MTTRLPSEWANSEVNKLSETEKNILPSQLMSSYITANNPLEDAQAWLSPQHYNLDRICWKTLKR